MISLVFELLKLLEILGLSQLRDSNSAYKKAS